MSRRLLVLLGWFAGLAAALAVLHGSGSGALAGPVLVEPATWGDWAARRTAPEAAMAVLRLVGIGLGWYLLAASALGVVARLVGGARTVELADLVAVPLVRRVVHTGLGVGLAGSVLAAASAGTIVGPRMPTAADVALASGAPAAPPVEREPVIDLREPSSPPPSSPEPAAEPQVRTWVIQPGDHLWSVADRVLTEAFGRPPVEREVIVYWKELVERNRHVLPDPDLVHAGLIIELPDPVPSRG